MSFISYYLSYVKLYFTLQITKIKPIEIMMIFSKSLRIKNSNSILKFVIIRPDFKILAYDLTCVTIRTSRAHDKVQDLFALNEEPNPVSEDKSDWVTFDGRMIYNKYAINDLWRMISEEIDRDTKPDFIIDANQNNLQY